MRPWGKLRGVDDWCAQTIKAYNAMMNCRGEKLPIVFTRSGDTLTGELSIKVGGDLRDWGSRQAEEYIRLAVAQVLIGLLTPGVAE